MKLKTLTLTTAVFFLFSCGTKQVATATTTTPSATVAEGHEAELTPELAESKNLYENSCVRCHKLYEPKKFTQDEWKPILTRMQKKAKLDDVQIASISNYITSQL
ncbi:cytochrome c [Flavobacterium piscis]|uniref:Cytochrome c5 n=1 Tax=Flavobacterium piscis TaxID=1114874 RepID=A0ABU1Y707_9FLAO|nr:cytochrome c [Flavobacterium piscis]MDR7210020.1 cytochrome c5 [Flavobacterium piscis]